MEPYKYYTVSDSGLIKETDIISESYDDAVSRAKWELSQNDKSSGAYRYIHFVERMAKVTKQIDIDYPVETVDLPNTNDV